MTQIIKKYWIWDEIFNPTDFKLGENIQLLSDRGLVVESKNELNVYYGINGYPWQIKTNKGYIESVAFRDDKFFPLCLEKIWDMESNTFIKTVEELFKPCDDDYIGDVLCVVFRGGFVAIAEIKRRGFN